MADYDPDKQSRDALNRGAGAYSTPGVDTREPEKPFTPSTAAPLVTFALRGIAPPSNLYVSQEDSLQLRCYNFIAGQTLQVFFRTLRPDGTVIQTSQTFQLAASQTIQSFTVNVEEGYLLGLLVSIGATGVAPHTFWVAVNVLRQASVQVLVSGYLTPGVFLGWPGGPMLLGRDGAGVLRSITGSTPAAGADISETVPSNTRWRLLSFRAQLTASATVANRQPKLTLDDGVNIFFTVDAAANQVAGAITINTWFPGCQPLAGISGDQIMPIPTDTFLSGGYRIRTSTTGIQVGDQWTAPQYEVLEWADQQ